MLVRIERLALRINGFHAGDVEGVHELAVRGEHAFTDGVLLLILRDLEGPLKAVDDGQQVFGKLLDAELAGLLNLLGGTAAGVFKLRHGLQHFLLCSLVALQCFICSLRQHLCVCANACDFRRAAQKAGERAARIDDLPVQADDTVAEPNTSCNLRCAVKVFCNNSAAEQRIADAGVLFITVAEC